jgi:Autophagy protein Apg6.
LTKIFLKGKIGYAPLQYYKGNEPFIPFYFFLQDTTEHKNLPLFASGGAKFFWDTKFDMAMVAFLDCLQQFKEELEKGDSEFHLPYNMDSKGKIEDETTGNTYSVK